MKNVQNVFAAVITLGILLASCEQLNLFSNKASDLIEEIASADNKTTVSTAELPAEILTYVSTNFFETYIETASLVENTGYEITLGSEDQLYFDTDGTSLDSVAGCQNDSTGNRPRRGHGRGPHAHGQNCGGLDSLVSLESLPAAIYTYISTTYGDSAEVRHAKLDNSGQYVVAITGHIILVFDASGNFVEVAQIIRHCRGGHGTPVAVSDLLAAITTYINTQYPGAEIKKAFQKDNGNFVVGILYNGTRVILVFDASGNFLAVHA
ncbi:MAG: PepSY-like domain-containing protein [Bacteroidia bacterium]|nr:PepSY-like domain-containing protein [Bacteroidia bacterium]